MAEDLLLGRVRDLVRRSRTDLRAFRELLDLLLRTTVLAPTYPGLRLYRSQIRDAGDIGGWEHPLAPVPLNDGRWLRLSISLFTAQTPDGHPGLKARTCSVQYQTVMEPGPVDSWICRYDYVREAADEHPTAHLQMNAELRTPGVLPHHRPLRSIHFPTQRVPIEGVLRLLAEQFGVRCNEPANVWRPVLATSEREFLAIAHQPSLGPDR